MMQKGYAGLAPKQALRDQDGRIADVASLEETQPREARHNSLQVIAVDRRASDRVQIPEFTPIIPARRRPYFFFKRVFDIVGAGGLILVFSPVLAALVIGTRFSGGPAFFSHRRVGRGGKTFNCIKFRTMVPHADCALQAFLDSNCEAKVEWLRDHKLRDDPRVTRLGRFLRRTSLDELPQLWNVLRGEMSLVGPRPVVPDELRRYGNKVGTFLSAPPGITGLWQISGRNDMDYRRRVALDVCYVRSRSLILDVYIIIKTIPVVFAGNGAY